MPKSPKLIATWCNNYIYIVIYDTPMVKPVGVTTVLVPSNATKGDGKYMQASITMPVHIVDMLNIRAGDWIKWNLKDSKGKRYVIVTSVMRGDDPHKKPDDITTVQIPPRKQGRLARTSIPRFIIKLLNLKRGDWLKWSAVSVAGELCASVTPVSKPQS